MREVAERSCRRVGDVSADTGGGRLRVTAIAVTVAAVTVILAKPTMPLTVAPTVAPPAATAVAMPVVATVATAGRRI